MKNFISKIKRGTLEYVFLHGLWRLSRGKSLSAILKQNNMYESNPQKAFEIASNMLKYHKILSFESIFSSKLTHHEEFFRDDEFYKNH